MCGIAGWVSVDDGTRTREQLVAMCDVIRHRGPDDEGYYVAPGVALGMRRLSIIDVAAGRQPVANEDDSIHAVFNGEIYNFRALRRQLELSGHRLTAHGDSETLVHLYEEHGTRLVHALRGMFAFALWDSRRARLLLARDRLGIKPLYYRATDDGVVFGSELRSFVTLDSFDPRLDRRAVAEYLAFGYVPDPLSIFSGVMKLPPGHWLTWGPERGVEIERYWSPVGKEVAHIEEQEAIEELQRLLGESVRSHLESDVPLGAFLSGGVDSSAVVAYMSRQTTQPVRTFSIGFDEADYNEAPHAAAVAAALGTQHTELIVRPDADALIEEVIRAFDEPFGDSSALPTYLVSRLARQHVTVALSGDGGDELFGGYTRYLELLGRRELRPRLLRSLLHRFARTLPAGAPGRNRLLDLGRTRFGRYAATVAIAAEPAEGGVALPEVGAEVEPLDHLLDRWTTDTAHRDFLSRMMLVDVQSYLPGDILTKVDRMSMAVSLEARVPLLDHVLVEFALSLPASLAVRDGQGKNLLRRVLANVVPPAVLSRPKRGFALPLGRWLRRDLNHRLDALLRSDSPIYEFVHPAPVARLVAEHRCARRDHSHYLWRLLALDLWRRSLSSGKITGADADRLTSIADAQVS